MAEFVPSGFVSDGHKYGWRFAKVWGTENPKGNPIAHIMIFHQLKFKAEIDGKTYTLGARSCYQNFDGSSQNILTGLNGYRSGSKSWLYVLYYDAEKPDAPDHKAGRPGTSIPSKITLEENEFICRLTVSTKSSDRAETTDVNEYSMGHMFAPLRTSLSDGLYSKWWCKIGILDDDGWDFCFEFDQTTSPKITGFSVSLENTTPSPGIPTEENQLTEANGLYLYMDDQAEIQVGGCRTNQELPAAFDSASIKSIELAVTKPLELRYKHTDGTIYELKSGTKVDTSNLVSLDGEQTITGAKSFDAAVTLNAEGTEPQHAVTKSYVDSKVTEGAQGALEGVAKLDATQTFTGANTFSGATNFTGAVTGADPQNATELATKQYVDSKVGEAAGAADNVVTLDGEQTITGVKTFSAAPVISVAPSADSDATNKAYVDSQVQAMANGGPIPEPAASSILFSGNLPLCSVRSSSATSLVVGPQYLNKLKLYTADGRRLDFIKVPTVPNDTTITDNDTSAWEGLQVVAKLVAADAAETTCDRVAPEEIESYSLQDGELKGTISYLPTLAPDANIAAFLLSFGPYAKATGTPNIGSWDAQGNYMGIGLGVNNNANLSTVTSKPVPLVRLDFDQAPKLARAEFTFTSFLTLLVDYSFDGVTYKTLQSGLNGTSSFDFEPAENGHDLAQKDPQVAQFGEALLLPENAGSGLAAVNRAYVHRHFMATPKSFLAVKGYSIKVQFPAYSTTKKTAFTSSSGSKTYGFTFPFALRDLKLETPAGPLFVRKYAKINTTTYKTIQPSFYILLSPSPCEPSSATTNNIADDMADYEFLVMADISCTPSAYSYSLASSTVQPGAFFNSSTDGLLTATTSLGQEVVGAHDSSKVQGKSGTASIEFRAAPLSGSAPKPDNMPVPNQDLMPVITHMSCQFDLATTRVCPYFKVIAAGGDYITFKQSDGTYGSQYTCTDPEYFGADVDAFIPEDVIKFDPGEDEESDSTYKTITYNPYVSRPEYEALEARIAALESAAAGA